MEKVQSLEWILVYLIRTPFDSYVQVTEYDTRVEGCWIHNCFSKWDIIKFWKVLRKSKANSIDFNIKMITKLHTVSKGNSKPKKAKTMKESSRMDFDFYKLAKYDTMD